jgi:hypothetical protein
MAQRRMFSLDIVDTDLFLEMPASTQNLYFHLGMRADDDGFVASPKRITTLVNCSGDDLKLLIAKGLVIPFDTGVCVIRDWKINNYIQKDRYRETIYAAEKSTLEITKTGSYSIKDTKCIQNVSTMDTQASIGKRRIELGKDNLGDNNCGDAASLPSKAERHKYGEYGWVLLTDQEYSRLLHDLGEAELRRCIEYVDESAQSTGNKNRWKDWNIVIRKCSKNRWGLNRSYGDKGGNINASNQRSSERNADYYTKGFHRADE